MRRWMRWAAYLTFVALIVGGAWLMIRDARQDCEARGGTFTTTGRQAWCTGVAGFDQGRRWRDDVP